MRREMAAVKRFRWLEMQVKNCGFKVGAEIGCESGVTTRHLLSRCVKLKLYAVDTWGDLVPEHLRSEVYNYHKKDFKKIYRLFCIRTEQYRKRLRILRGISWEMAEHVKDESLDFIFIDADHGYKTVMKDIKAWYPKVRRGGLVSGHDYNPNHKDVIGVVKAVDEFFGKENILVTKWDYVWYIWKR